MWYQQVFQLTVQQAKCKQCSAATGKFFCAFHYTDSNREDQMHKAICRHDCRWSVTDQSCQSESFRPFLLSTRYVAALCKIYTKFLSVYTQYCTHYRKQMNCENNFMGLIPTIIFKWSLVPLISFPVPPLQWNMVVRHQAVGVFFSDWGRSGLRES